VYSALGTPLDPASVQVLRLKLMKQNINFFSFF
jgi:hypothetical protein